MCCVNFRSGKNPLVLKVRISDPGFYTKHEHCQLNRMEIIPLCQPQKQLVSCKKDTHSFSAFTVMHISMHLYLTSEKEQLKCQASIKNKAGLEKLTKKGKKKQPIIYLLVLCKIMAGEGSL